MKIKIALCDSDAEFCRYIKNLIESRSPECETEIQTTIFLSAEELFSAEIDFHLYFLDIKGINGLELARKVRKREEENRRLRSIIVFVTGFGEHMEAAFDVQAFHYLLKPVNAEKFYRVLERALKEIEFAQGQAENYVLLKLSDITKKVFLRDIFCVESNNKKVTVRTVEGNFEVEGTMSGFENALGENFYRSHRCCLVNFAHISAYNQKEITLTNGDIVLLAYKKYSAFVRAYLDYAKKGGAVNV